jgi:hypothetical protein
MKPVALNRFHESEKYVLITNAILIEWTSHMESYETTVAHPNNVRRRLHIIWLPTSLCNVIPVLTYNIQ